MMMAWPAVRTLSRLICVAGLVATATAASAQQAFKTPAEAATALVEAARGTDEKRLRSILGIVGRDTLHSGDDVADAADRKRFIEAYDSRHSVSEQGDKATLLVGPDDFPFPIPIMRSDKGWSFDGVAGRSEILARRIGRNELAAIQASLAYFDAQQEYAAKDRTGQGRGIYAQRIVSRAGAKDGLYWDSAAGEEPSPLGEFAAGAAAEGYRAEETRRPFHGYYYKILTRQGPSAPGGAIDYVAGGRMIGGFGLLAYPAEYGRSGVKSFMLNHDGTVYEKDLGPNTGRIAGRMQSFNPDKGWEKVAPQK
ncbi:MAG TPA: DUF2950 domain-containing protein [Bosea sp. (in: a-proteobacteria)]|jgi:hypothetical protein|uniref:DUF2950 domain-containing protein n=1 Tax=Bosea sp. (in: a-proteobacteria) TaxID=1871050 RepID=UPI002E0E14E8|nr:DUF2950 domain-containing protein [Bosea sp. (in: a-proteobacteria)]